MSLNIPVICHAFGRNLKSTVEEDNDCRKAIISSAPGQLANLFKDVLPPQNIPLRKGERIRCFSSFLCQARQRLSEDPMRTVYEHVSSSANHICGTEPRFLFVDGTGLQMCDTKESVKISFAGALAMTRRVYQKARYIGATVLRQLEKQLIEIICGECVLATRATREETQTQNYVLVIQSRAAYKEGPKTAEIEMVNPLKNLLNPS